MHGSENVKTLIYYAFHFIATVGVFALYTFQSLRSPSYNGMLVWRDLPILDKRDDRNM